MLKSTNPLLYFRAATKSELKDCEKFSGPYDANEIYMIPNIINDAAKCNHAIYFSRRLAGRKTSVTIYLKRLALKKTGSQTVTDFFMTLTESQALKAGSEIHAKINNFNEAYRWIVETLKTGHTPILIEKDGEITGALIRKKIGEKPVNKKRK